MKTEQKPIGSGFEASTTTDEVMTGIDLAGKVAIVTGGYSGLGLETVRTFHKAGAKVIVPARDHRRAAVAVSGLEGVEVKPMDLLDPASIDRFAREFLDSGLPLHIIVNSAGIMACPLTRDARGYEAQWATNHLGHFQLVNRLWPALKQAKGARVVSVSSMGHRYSPVVFEDPNFERREYDRWAAYGQSKTANILFAVEVDKRGKPNDIRAFSLHPGSIVGTGLEKHLSRAELIAGGVLDENGQSVLDPKRQLKTVKQGAATQVWCATSPQLDGMGGVYCENVDVAELMLPLSGKTTMKDSTLFRGVLPYAIDPDQAARLWALSEQLIG